MARLVEIRQGGRMIWRAQQEPLQELVDRAGGGREWQPVHPLRAPHVIAAMRHAARAQAQAAPRLRREQIEILPAGPVEVYDMAGPRPRLVRRERAVRQMRQMIPYQLQPYVAAVELVAMVALTTRALEGDL